MPRLTGPRTAARILCAFGVAVAPLAAAAQDAVAVRPTGPHLTAQMLKAFADAAPSVRLTREQYPEAGDLSLREVIQALCGSTPDDYLKILKERTGLTDADVNRRPSAHVYDIDIPNCPYVSPVDASRRYVAKAGDTYSTIRERFTGVQGDDATNARFFGLPQSLIRSGRLSPGTSLRIPYFTAETVLSAAEAKGVLASIETPQGAAPQDFMGETTTPVGRIVTYLKKADGAPDNPVECGASPVAPFPAAAVAEAFDYSRKRAKALHLRFPNNVDVLVADNGFFGAKPKTGGGYEFRSPAFDSRYFETTLFGKRLGPTIGSPPTLTFPVNYQNNLSPSEPLSGHGTHVTGLVLGGSTFLTQRPDVYGPSDQVGWLKIAQLNLARGSDTLLTGSNKELALHLLLLSGMRIVNMSISYDGSGYGVLQSFAFMDEGKGAAGAGRHLFVVAAGNDKTSATKFQPAGRGGPGVESVITVGALNPAGRLAGFSNFGGAAVDVAAPGCNLESWIDFDGKPEMLSGTSQATPIVTFQLTLIRALTGASPGELKLRAIASGDILDPGDVKRVASHLKVNVPRSLYVFDDYVRWGPPGADRAVLGRVVQVTGLTCDDGTTVELAELGAYKRDSANLYAYRRGKESSRLVACDGVVPAAEGVVVVEPAVEAKSGYPASPEAAKTGPERFITIPAGEVRDITMRLIDAG